MTLLFYLKSHLIFLLLQSHTILLVQPTKRPEGRTYADYESVNECMEGTSVALMVSLMMSYTLCIIKFRRIKMNIKVNTIFIFFVWLIKLVRICGLLVLLRDISSS